MSDVFAFDSWQAFISMGGHGLYVWASYGLFILLMLGLVGTSYWQMKSWAKKERRKLARERIQNQNKTQNQNQKPELQEKSL